MCKHLMNPLVRSVLGTMSTEDQYDLKMLIDSIYNHPELGTKLRHKKGAYYRKTHGVTKRRYPDGLRVIYTYVFGQSEVEIVAIIDMGDHRTCCNDPGYSVYEDER